MKSIEERISALEADFNEDALHSQMISHAASLQHLTDLVDYDLNMLNRLAIDIYLTKKTYYSCGHSSHCSPSPSPDRRRRIDAENGSATHVARGTVSNLAGTPEISRLERAYRVASRLKPESSLDPVLFFRVLSSKHAFAHSPMRPTSKRMMRA
jgi:hypothetical protein